MPASCAFFAASNAACWAANGVPLREPRKPRAPADDCAIKFPSRSVIEIIVLLNDAAICTMPLGTFFFSFLRKTFFFPPALAITFQSNQKLLLARCLLLRNGGTTWAFARASVRVGSLATHRQSTTMSQTAIATDIHQTLDVHLDALAQVAFDLALCFQDGTNPAQLIFSKIPDASVETDARFLEHRIRTRAANAVDGSETNLRSFVWW